MDMTNENLDSFNMTQRELIEQQSVINLDQIEPELDAVDSARVQEEVFSEKQEPVLPEK